MVDFDPESEFQKQIISLVSKGYPSLAGMSESQFVSQISLLKEKVNPFNLKAPDIEQGYLPFVIVINSNLIPSETMMSKVEKNGKRGITKLFPHQSSDFSNIEKIKPPKSEAYLLVDIDRGEETLNMAPKDAFEFIIKQDRSPLSIDEGIAILTHYPEFLIKNNCFSLLASRKSDNKCVPAIWINSAKQPNLGWCWEGNPHTWLGSASCKDRIVCR